MSKLYVAARLLFCVFGEVLMLNSAQAPTFDRLGLKEDLLRGIYAYSQRSSALRVKKHKLT
jgi:hypothetical protein